MSGKKNRKDEQKPPVLVLTGQMRDGMHLIRLFGRDVWLTREEFQAIVALAHAKVTDKDSATISDATIRSLRARIDAALGQPGLGELLIPAL